MHKVQKTYTVEFKREAVRLAQTSGKPIAQVAREGVPVASGQESTLGVGHREYVCSLLALQAVLAH